MDNPSVQPEARDQQRALHHGGESVQDGTGLPVEVIVVDESWWNTRPKLGIHVLNPSKSKMKLATNLARRQKTHTVYVYKKVR